MMALELLWSGDGCPKLPDTGLAKGRSRPLVEDKIFCHVDSPPVTPIA